MFLSVNITVLVWPNILYRQSSFNIAKNVDALKFFWEQRVFAISY